MDCVYARIIPGLFMYFPMSIKLNSLTNGIQMYRNSTILSGLLHYWSFDNHYYDIMQCKQFYDVTNSTYFARDTTDNTGFFILIRSSYLIADPGIYFYGDLTISVWIRAISFNANAKIIDFGNGVGLDNVVFFYTHSTTGLPSASFYNISASNFLISNTAIKLNQWAYIALVLENNNAKIYVDAKLAVTTNMIKIRNIMRTKNYLGKSNWGSDLANADFKDLKIFNRALNLNEIQLNMN